MQPDDIIKQFEVYTDDSTELSDQEEYALLTKTLNTIYNDRAWEFLRKNATVATTTVNSLPVPDDFVSPMNNYSENAYNNLPEKAVVYVNGTPFFFIPRGMAVQKAGGQYAYVDPKGRKIYFTQNVGTGVTCLFDYKYLPPDVTSNLSDIALPEQFKRYVGQAMAVDDDIIQKTEKARSNYQANSIARAQLVRDLTHYDLRLQNY